MLPIEKVSSDTIFPGKQIVWNQLRVQLPVMQKVVTRGKGAVDHKVSVLQHTVEPALEDVGSHRGNHGTGVQNVGEEALVALALVETDLGVDEDLEASVDRL